MGQPCVSSKTRIRNLNNVVNIKISILMIADSMLINFNETDVHLQKQRNSLIVIIFNVKLKY